MECFLPCCLCSSGAVWIVFGVHVGLLRALVWVAVKWSENRELLVDEQVLREGSSTADKARVDSVQICLVPQQPLPVSEVTVEEVVLVVIVCRPLT